MRPTWERLAELEADPRFRDLGLVASMRADLEARDAAGMDFCRTCWGYGDTCEDGVWETCRSCKGDRRR